MLLSFNNAAVEPLWSQMNLAVDRGEFIAVLGPNGVGKSTLLGTILGTRQLTAGSVDVNCGGGYPPPARFSPPPGRGRPGCVFARRGPRGPGPHRRPDRGRVDELLAEVGATGIANRRVGQLSGGQQQLIRQAQALANDPEVILADEPLLSLDPARQQATVAKLDAWRRERGTSIIFVTHGINPVLGVVDKVLYIAPNGHTFGAVEDVMRSEVLSELYGSDVTVINVDGRLIVV